MSSFRRHAECHPDKKHHAKGLCSICYGEQRRDAIKKWKIENKARLLYKQHEWQKRLPRRTVKKYALKSRFGITIERYDEMLLSQGGVCAICGRAPKTIALCVDHNHQTGEVRGLLCRGCNTSLRLFDGGILWENTKKYLKLGESK